MEYNSVIQALVLGITEGITEFLPISSTGHLLLLSEYLGFKGPPGNMFEVVIQLGAILAVCWIYRDRIIDTALHAHNQAKAQHFLGNLILAFLPAAIIGFFTHDYIKEHLFDPVVIAYALIIGGVVILLVEWKKPPADTENVDLFSWRMALAIGFFQVLALIPGVSRSGATIMGALMLGANRRSATEFSFFLSIPTIGAATMYDLYKNIDQLDDAAWSLIAVGFVCAFASAFLVVRVLVDFVSRHGFAVFAWYRILFGGVLLYFLS